MAASPDLTNLGAATNQRRSKWRKKFRLTLHGLTGSSVDLLDELGEFTGDVGSVAIKDRGVTGTDLSRVVEDNDLGVERSGLLGGVVLRVGTDVSSSNVLDGHVLHVETDVVSWETLGDLLVVHLDRLDLGGDVLLISTFLSKRDGALQMGQS